MLLKHAIILALLSSLLTSPAQAKDTVTLLMFGDSLLSGYRLKPNESVPVRLEGFLRKYDARITVINAGVSGDTTTGGRQRLQTTAKTHMPDIVLLALGGNDVLRGVPPATIRDNLNAMLSLLQQLKTPEVILSAALAPDQRGEKYKNEINLLYSDLARTYGVRLYPFLIEKTYGNRELMLPDGVHPNARGAELIARDLAIYLVKTLSFKSF